jgi:Phytanoyl-CoA dioxygenase (PhyH)
MELAKYSYGVTQQYQVADEFDEKVLELKINGYTTLDSGLTSFQIQELKEKLDFNYEKQAEEVGGIDILASWGDANILRAALTYDVAFLDVSINSRLLELSSRYLGNEYVLMMQNGLINKPGHGNEQGKYHRDLNYQHWTSSSPIAMNALLCLDDFTAENGATWVVPATHHLSEFPSETFVVNHSRQVLATAGTFLVLDGMLFHKAGTNQTSMERRAINHVIGLPFMAQTIDLPKAMKNGQIPMPDDKKIQRYLGTQWGPVDSALAWRLKKFGNS